MIAFLDANALIYLLEGEAEQARRVQDCLRELASEAPRLTIAMSRLFSRVPGLACRFVSVREERS